ncbi:unnamed protein product [Amoebophrya sp. A25]|nr:unnamed protein product [Amoebophrya sp. A25]|eukprot:GSA25T00019230001.1
MSPTGLPPLVGPYNRISHTMMPSSGGARMPTSSAGTTAGPVVQDQEPCTSSPSPTATGHQGSGRSSEQATLLQGSRPRVDAPPAPPTLRAEVFLQPLIPPVPQTTAQLYLQTGIFSPRNDQEEA